MITRRNIRVKVMQLTYAIETGMDVSGKNDPLLSLQKQLTQSRDLFVYLLYFLTEVAQYAQTDSKTRALKNLPVAGDMNVNTKIAGNEWVKKITNDSSFKKVMKEINFNFEDTRKQVKKVYANLVSTGEYQKYIQQDKTNKQEERDIIEFVFTDMMLPDEDFTEHIEEHFVNWDDDAEMINQLMLSFLKKPGSFNLQDMLGQEKKKFAESLLLTTLDKKDNITAAIAPKLKNWDADRIASLDMILMRMGVCEFLYFETIPPKVTINEYIDIAKEYSTPQSGQFVNGILDNIHKELIAENKIHKIDFKQKA